MFFSSLFLSLSLSLFEFLCIFLLFIFTCTICLWKMTILYAKGSLNARRILRLSIHKLFYMMICFAFFFTVYKRSTDTNTHIYTPFIFNISNSTGVKCMTEGTKKLLLCMTKAFTSHHLPGFPQIQCVCTFFKRRKKCSLVKHVSLVAL